jgi:WD40 repeat protein
VKIKGFDGVNAHHAVWVSDTKAYITASKSNFNMLMEVSTEKKKATATLPLGDRTNVEMCFTLKDGSMMICLLADSAKNSVEGYSTYKALTIDLQNGASEICMFHETKSMNTEMHEKPVFCAAKLDDNTALLGCHNDVMMWQPPEKECTLVPKEGMRTWLRHSLREYTKLKQAGSSPSEKIPVTALTVSSDGQSIVSGNDRGSIFWWKNVSKAEAPNVDHGIHLTGHSAAVSA